MSPSGSARFRGRRKPAVPVLAVGTLVLVAFGIACGKKGPPMAPRPRGPLPPTGVSARQLGDRAEIRFTVSPARGDAPVQQPASAELVRLVYSPGLEAPVDSGAFRRRGKVVGETSSGSLTPNGVVRFVDELGALPDGGVGSTLRYAVRVRDRKNRVSPLVVAKDLVPLPDSPPATDLRAEPTAEGVRLTWKAPGGPQASLFNVYRFDPGGKPGDVPLHREPLGETEFLDPDVVPGQRYEYAVRVALARGLPARESGRASTVEVMAEDRFAPGAPRGLVVVQEAGAARLFWNPNAERDLAGYRVYRRDDDGPWVRVPPEIVVQPLHRDETVEVGVAYTYRVTAVDLANPPNESEPSAEFALAIREEPDDPAERIP